MIDWIMLLLQLLIGLAIASFTAWVTVRYSLHQFRSERWWEKKVETYSAIVGALAQLQFILGEWWEYFFFPDTTMSDERQAQLASKSQVAHEAIETTVAAGAFIISERAAKSLELLLKQLDEGNPDIGKEVDTHYGAVRDCIAVVIEEAKQDLNISSPPMLWRRRLLWKKRGKVFKHSSTELV